MVEDCKVELTKEVNMLGLKESAKVVVENLAQQFVGKLDTY